MSHAKGDVLINIIEWQDREAVVDLLETGKVQEAKEMIMTLAPPYDPEAVDARGASSRNRNIAFSSVPGPCLSTDEEYKALAMLKR